MSRLNGRIAAANCIIFTCFAGVCLAATYTLTSPFIWAFFTVGCTVIAMHSYVEARRG